jgi:transcriptional regulator with XRE-family HTH domain
MPSGGELLRGMRQRRGLYLAQAAEALGVSAGTLSRWEQGKVAPSTEHLEAALTLLRAHPLEREALIGRFPFLIPPLRETAPTLEALRAYFLSFAYASYANRVHPLHDLRFLTLAAAAWPFALRCPAGQHLLADVYAHYASYLADVRRYGEAKRAAERSLEALPEKSTPPICFVRAATVYASASVFCGPQPAPQRGIDMLRLWLPLTQRPDYKSWMLEDMARYVALQGDLEGAVRLSQEACRVVSAHDNPNELPLRRLGLARLQLRAGHMEEALSLATFWPECTPFHRADVELVWAEGMLASGDRSHAEAWLLRAYADIDAHALEHLRPAADTLAQRL